MSYTISTFMHTKKKTGKTLVHIVLLLARRRLASSDHVSYRKCTVYSMPTFNVRVRVALL